MALTRCTCPSCHATLKLAAPVADGKHIKCPRCAAVFPASEEEAPAVAGRRPAVAEQGRAGGASARDPGTAAGTQGRRARPPEEELPDEADEDYEEERQERSRRRRPAGKGKQRRASLALRVSALLLGLIGGLFSGGLGVAWLAQAHSPEVKAMRELAGAIADEVGSQELKADLARLDRMVRSSYFLLLAAPLGVAGGVLALLGRGKLGGALMLAAVPVPLALNVVTLMPLYFLVVGGLLALLTPSWPPGGGPSSAVMALPTAGGWVALLVGWVVLILSLPKPVPEVKAVPPGQRGGVGGGPGSPPPGPAPGGTPTPSPRPPGSPADAATPISAEQLTREYLTDPGAADRKFKGKPLAVDGVVHFNFLSRPEWFSVELKGARKGDGELAVVVCFLRKDLRGKLSPDAVREGQPARLKGRCTGLDWLKRPSLADCELAGGAGPTGAGAPAGGGRLAWKEFTFEEAGISILFPGAPTGDTDGSLRRFYLSLEGGELVYFVGSEELSEEHPKWPKGDREFLDQFKKPKYPGRKTIRNKDITLGKYPGVEHVEESTEGPTPVVQILRAYAAGDRRYQLGVFYAKRREAQAEASKFLDSFKPLPTAGGGKGDKVFGKTVGEWVKELKSAPTALARSVAAQRLAQFGPKAKEAVPALVEALHKDDGMVGYYAASALKRVGPDAVKGLTEAAKDEKPGVRFLAVRALGEMRPVPKEAVKVLTEALKDKHERVREQAALALERIKAKEGKKE